MLLKAVLPQSVIRVQVDLGLPVDEIEEPDIPDPLDPRIILTGSLAPFETEEGTASAAQSYGVQGVDLTDGILVEAPVGFEISTDAETWDEELTLASDFNGTVYVRLTGEVAGQFGGYLAHTHEGATTQWLLAQGVVAEQEPEVKITAWDGAGNEIAAVAFGGYDYWVFKDDGTMEVEGEPEVDVLLVGGGGRGGNSSHSSLAGGGGGAGGLLLNKGLSLTAPKYAFAIAQASTVGEAGGNTLLVIPVEGDEATKVLEAWGGGAGGDGVTGTTAENQIIRNGKDGGSGGGGVGYRTSGTNYQGVGGLAITLDPMQGYDGGNSAETGTNLRGAGGGGGARRVGYNATDLSGGNGARGWSLDSANVFDSEGLTAELIDKLALDADFDGICGGGGGGGHSTVARGYNGGGSGGINSDKTGSAAKPNSGSGGGGGYGTENGGTGGSGIAIVRHLRAEEA